MKSASSWNKLMNLPLKINSHIWIEKDKLSDDFITDLREHLQVKVEEYSGDVIHYDFYEEIDGLIKVPKGMLHGITKALEAEDFKCVHEHSKYSTVDFNFSPISLRDHQPSVIDSILDKKIGIYQAPPGSGKTVTALEATRRASVRTLILVDKVSIASQWIDRAQQFLNIEDSLSPEPVNVGLIGDNVFDIQDITVATRQSIYSKKDELKKNGFFDSWGMVIVDEVHHIQSNSYQEIIQEFNSEYLIGLSATPHKTPGMEKVVKFMIGDVIHKTEESELQGLGILMKPKVYIRPTHFDKEYKTWIFSGKQRNNYQSILKALVESNYRNNLICDDIFDLYSSKRQILVITKRLKHIELLEKILSKMGVPKERMIRLTGKETTTQRVEILENLETLDSFVLFSTIADEALDIPYLDALVNVFPARQAGLIIQQLGRVERSSENKKRPIVIDYQDLCSVLNNQFYARLQVYREKELEVEFS